MRGLFAQSREMLWIQVHLRAASLDARAHTMSTPLIGTQDPIISVACNEVQPHRRISYKISNSTEMAQLRDHKLLCFDIYGTLIDWESGIYDALQPLLKANQANLSKEQVLTIYHEVEKAQQAKTPDLKYADLLGTIYPQIAAQLGLGETAPEQSEAFGQSIGHWPAFPDTVDALRRLGKHYRLVPLSNTDRESLSRTIAGPLQGVSFDMTITAQDVGSYKPDLRNFEYMLREVRDRFGVTKDQVLQTAQSQVHDHHPARKMGIKSCWIVRPGAVMGNCGEEIHDWRFDTLGHMADALEGELTG